MNAAIVIRSAYLAAIIVFASVLALCSFAFAVTLPKNAGAYQFIDTLLEQNHLLVFVALPLSILFLVAPFYAAKWTYLGVLKAGLSIEKRIKRQNEK